jgi:hypothetical protein
VTVPDRLPDGVRSSGPEPRLRAEGSLRVVGMPNG